MSRLLQSVVRMRLCGKMEKRLHEGTLGLTGMYLRAKEITLLPSKEQRSLSFAGPEVTYPEHEG